MPNWCEGTLKVRGSLKHLKTFVLNALKECGYAGNPPEGPLLDVYEIEQGFEAKLNRMAYLEGTSRGFVDDDQGYQFFELENKEGDQILLLRRTQFAWDINAGELQHLCTKYHVDMKITAFEQGMEFQRDVEIVKGAIVLDTTTKYSDYQWQCPRPCLGG